MSLSKGYERMNQLAAQVQHALRELEAGRLDLAGLDNLTDDARALFERLVVLRHKAHEAMAREQQATPADTAGPIRLDTRPVDPLLRQTSLIDAIAETEQQAPAPKRRSSIADSMEKAPTADLARSITLSDKFWFVAELFGGDKEKYDRTVRAINTATDLEQAKELVDKEAAGPRGGAPAENVLEAFMELVQRRFR